MLKPPTKHVITDLMCFLTAEKSFMGFLQNVEAYSAICKIPLNNYYSIKPSVFPEYKLIILQTQNKVWDIETMDTCLIAI